MGEKYRSSGWYGPSVCNLCLQAQESIQHLFVDCDIFEVIWKEVCDFYKVSGISFSEPLNYLLMFWSLSCLKFRNVPLFVLLFIWKFTTTTLCLKKFQRISMKWFLRSCWLSRNFHLSRGLMFFHLRGVYFI